MSRLRIQICQLLAACLLCQAVLPLGLALPRPGAAIPIIICSELGALAVDARTGEPLPDKRGPSKAAGMCILCQAMNATALLPDPAACPLPALHSAAVQTPPLTGAVTQGMAFRFGIFARPPPVRA